MDNDLLARFLRRKAEKRALSFAALPSDPPTSFSASAHDNWAVAVGQKTGVPYPASAQIKTPWRWVGSTAEFDGVARGGLRDVLKADGMALNQIKAQVDVQSQAILDLRADVQALKEAPVARPFP